MKIRIKYSLIAFCSMLAVILHSQETPDFLTYIAIEDAIGNTDTLWIGQDEEANNHEINEQFGEKEITEPFDSLLEIRGIHGFASELEEKFSKTIVEKAEKEDCHWFVGTRMYIHAKYPPITVHWDSTYFAENVCYANTILAVHNFMYFIQYWHEAQPLHCMSTSYSYTDSLAYDGEEDFEDINTFAYLISKDWEVEGQGVKTINGFIVVTFLGDYECLVLLDNEEIPINEKVEVYPSITEDQLFIDTDLTKYTVSLLDSQGREVLTKEFGGNASISLIDIPRGMFFCQIYSNGKLYKVQKIVVL